MSRPDALLLETSAEGAPLDGATLARRSGGFSSRAKATLIFLWKYLAGIALCQNAVGSVLVVGWTYRLAQRSVRKQWWKASRARDDGTSFDEFLRSAEPRNLRWPNWIVRPPPPMPSPTGGGLRVGARSRFCAGAGLIKKVRLVNSCLLGSLGANAKVGAQAILNTWVLTLPACAAWLVAWYDGWNNSFNKGYEQAAVGPATGLFGVALFIAAMFYVPMAQARQASTGSWRSFYQFRLIWGLIARNRLKCLGLAALYFVISLPVTVLKTAPVSFEQAFPRVGAMTDAEVLEFANTYFFWAAAAVFPCYVLVHVAAARIYAKALIVAVRDCRIAPSDLAPDEAHCLAALNLLEQRPRPLAPLVVRAAGRGASLTIGTALLAATAAVWFGFVAQIFISEFLNYHPVVGWLNQPLVQLPWFHYVPGHLTP